MTTIKKDMLAFNFDSKAAKSKAEGITIVPPNEFSFTETLNYLSRSPSECLHHVEDRKKIYKLLDIERDAILIEISETDRSALHIRFVNDTPNNQLAYKSVEQYVIEWFDLKRELVPFYLLAENDPLLSGLTKEYFGLRIIGIPDLFEALCWAVIGQQVNLAFAYTLKKRFVESFGECIQWNNRSYWLFPKPQVIAAVTIEELKKLQFTGKKAEYIIGIAQLIQSGTLSKEALVAADFKAAEQRLLSIRGIGPWTAHYVLMRCLRDPSAFPIGDAGLQNALKLLLQRTQKPSLEEIRQIFTPWQNWEAYVVFYLWRSLT